MMYYNSLHHNGLKCGLAYVPVTENAFCVPASDESCVMQIQLPEYQFRILILLLFIQLTVN